ncbi:hypothetical protein HPB50_004383 [Hyalomma asiaticum]|uniref:Uncharacterized protein n=1 Tax=Hyalomma asiaticum TaxID=266040 RepID=A0ACB7RIX8_HYAAI|nr:hypothetical protein HPB50_004383 [Hyalomma asiaticum]
MPDRGGLRALHRLSDSVSGANWRPTRFEDELTLSRFACAVCHVIPSTTVVLPCSHALCEQCLGGCVGPAGGKVCPLDAEEFCEGECQKQKLPPKKKQHLKAHCWNEDDGCEFVGTIEDVLLHYDRECAFHAIQCPRCGGRILRAGLAAHYVAGCSENVPSAGGAPKNRQDGPSVGCDTSAMQQQLPTIQRQVIELPGTPDSQLLQDIRRAVTDLESSCLRGMTGIEANICSMVTRQLNAGMEELKALIRDPGSNHVMNMQSQINEFFEHLRGRRESQIQEIVRVLRDSGSERKEDVNTKLEEMTHVLRTCESNVKDDVKTQLETVAPLLRASENRLMENANTHAQKIVHALNDNGRELKEHITRVEDNVCSTLSEQHQSLQRELHRLQQKKESTENEGVDVVKEDDMPWRTEKKLILRKLEVFAEESLKTLQFMGQQIQRHDKKPWVSDVGNCYSSSCRMWTKGANWRPTRFTGDLTLVRYACCVCDVIPPTVVVLPCSHPICEHCLTGCVTQDGGTVCPMDAQPFREGECQKATLSAKMKQSLKAPSKPYCCTTTGNAPSTPSSATTANEGCSAQEIAAHYVAGCSQNFSTVNDAQPDTLPMSFTSCDAAAILGQLSAVQRQMNELVRRSACLEDITLAVSNIELSCLSRMNGIGTNMRSMITRQLNDGLEQLKALIREPNSDQLALVQTQMNELVEESRAHDDRELRDIVRELRDSTSELKDDVKAEFEQVKRALRDSQSELQAEVKAQLQALLPALREST